MALPQRKEERANTDIRQPANENRKPERPQPRLVVDNTGTKVPAREQAPRIVPGSTRVERKREQAPGEIRPGTRPTVSEEFRERQYGNPYAQPRQTSNVQRETKEETPQRARKKKRSKRKRIRRIKEKRPGSSTTRRILRSVRATRATWIAAGVCLTLIGYQIMWAVISFGGFGVESGAIGLSSFLGVNNAITRAIDAGIQWLFPGASLGVLGWVMASIIGLLQMVIVYIIYVVHLINPLKGTYPLSMFFLTLALYFMPVGFFPWIVLWMHAVWWHALQK